MNHQMIKEPKTWKKQIRKWKTGASHGHISTSEL